MICLRVEDKGRWKKKEGKRKRKMKTYYEKGVEAKYRKIKGVEKEMEWENKEGVAIDVEGESEREKRKEGKRKRK